MERPGRFGELIFAAGDTGAHLNGVPERTLLNVRHVDELSRGDYVVEKIIFESRPGFYVTGNLYRPK